MKSHISITYLQNILIRQACSSHNSSLYFPSFKDSRCYISIPANSSAYTSDIYIYVYVYVYIDIYGFTYICNHHPPKTNKIILLYSIYNCHSVVYNVL